MNVGYLGQFYDALSSDWVIKIERVMWVHWDDGEICEATIELSSSVILRKYTKTDEITLLLAELTPKEPQNLPKICKSVQSFSKFPKSFQKLPKTSKSFQNFPKISKKVTKTLLKLQNFSWNYL